MCITLTNDSTIPIDSVTLANLPLSRVDISVVPIDSLIILINVLSL